MNYPDPVASQLDHFSSLVPLFPLPNVILFPHGLLPLHIFEPRYRKMTADALEGERLIAISLLRKEWHSAIKPSAPPIHPMVGIGQIVAHEKLADGRYMLVLRGLSRARLIGEENVDLPYRLGRVELCPDVIPARCDFDRQQRSHDIVNLFCRLFPGEKFQRLIDQAMTVDLSLGTICDTIASAMPMDPELSQQLLDETNVDLRSQMLWQLLQHAADHKTDALKKEFPPKFSSN